MFQLTHNQLNGDSFELRDFSGIKSPINLYLMHNEIHELK